MASKNRLAILLLFACLMFFPALGSFGIMDPSDGLYAEAAREMVESGNYFTPHFNYTPFLEKPILVYWLIALSYKIFGVSEFAARLPAALAAVETTIFVYWTIKDYVSKRAAFLACVVIISNVLFSVIGHLALTDMEMTCFSTLASMSLFKFLNSTGAARQRFFLLTCVCLSITCLLKGPVIIVITALVLTVDRLLLCVMSDTPQRETTWQYICGLQPFLAATIITALTAPWYLVENWLTGGAFFQEFFVHQNLGRITGTINHIEPFWFYVPITFASFMPWTVLTPIAVIGIRRLLRRRHSLTRRTKLFVFCLVWGAVCFLFFSAIRTKLPTYILPGVPQACIVIGIMLDSFARLSSRWSRRYTIGCASIFGLFAFAGIIAINVSYAKMKEPSGLVLLGFIAAVAVLTIGMFALLYISNSARRSFPSQTVALTWLCAILFLTPSSLLYYYQVKHAALRDIVLHAAGANLATFWRDTTAGVFYHRKKVALVMTVEDLDRFLQTAGRPHQIIVTNDLIPFLKLEARSQHLHCVEWKGNYSLYDLDRPN